MTKIISLEIRDFQKISVAMIEPRRAVVQINGKNEAGKSSVLDAIMAAIRGTKYTAIEPIRKGAERAVITLDLGEIKIERTYKKTKDGDLTTAIRLVDAKGFSKDKPQSFLNTLLPEIAYDPIQFAFSKPDEQYETFKKFVKGVDFEAIAKANEDDYAERTIQNRLVDERRAQAAGLDPGEIRDPIDEAALQAELEEIHAFNGQRVLRISAVTAHKARAEELDRVAVGFKDKIRDIELQLVTAKSGLQKIEALIVEHDMNRVENADDIPPSRDTKDVTARMQVARAHNTAIATMKERAARKAALLAEAEAAAQKSAALTKAMEDRKAEAKAAIAKSELPVKGITFGDKVLLYNDLPLAQANLATKIRLSIAVAAALSPLLKVALVHNGNDLDEDSWKLLEEFAAEKDHQIWVERIIEAGEGGFEIVDGTLKE